MITALYQTCLKLDQVDGDDNLTELRGDLFHAALGLPASCPHEIATKLRMFAQLIREGCPPDAGDLDAIADELAAFSS